MIQKDKRWILSSQCIKSEFVKSNNKERINDNKAKLCLLFFTLFKAFIRVIYYYVVQYSVRLDKSKIGILTVIVNSDRGGYEIDNIHKITDIDNNTNYCIHGFNMFDFMKYHRVSFINMIFIFFQSCCDFYLVLRSGLSQETINSTIKNGAVNVSVYTFLRSFFNVIKTKFPNCTVYSCGVYMASHASINSKIKTVNIYHGLISMINPDTFPAFDEIYVYSTNERKYLKEMRVESEIMLYPQAVVQCHEKIIIIFLPTMLNEGADVLASIISLFVLNNYKVYAKTHPLNVAWEIKKWSSIINIDSIIFIENIYNTSSAIEHYKPEFVISWTSTSLCEALNMGIIPITLGDENEYYGDPYQVYPIYKKSLLWPRDNQVIEKLILSKSDYNSIINDLRKVDNYE